MKKRNLLDRITDMIELQTEPLPGKPLVEILSDQSVLIENHRGINGYSCEMVGIKTATGSITVHGNHLVLNKISKEQLHIQGQIFCVKIHRR